MRKLLVILSAVAISLASFSCASGTYAKVKSEKVNPQFKGGPGKKILVVMATADPAMRENVETQFAIEGVNGGIDITPSHRLVPTFKDVTRERLEDLVKTNGFDRVIIASIQPGSAKTGEHSEMADHYAYVDSGFGSMYGYWGMTYTTVFTTAEPPTSMAEYIDLGLQTRMFDAADASMIWDSTIRVTSSRRQGEGAISYVKTVLRNLRRSGLI